MARPHVQDARVLFGEHLGELGDFGPRPDQRHVALQHVPQLRQLVELGAAQQATHAGDARGRRPL
jgi:hypothetical protein